MWHQSDAYQTRPGGDTGASPNAIDCEAAPHAAHGGAKNKLDLLTAAAVNDTLPTVVQYRNGRAARRQAAGLMRPMRGP